jgi:hypothetical protein
MEDNKSKAEALNKQFQSVFTGEDMSTLPQMDRSPFLNRAVMLAVLQSYGTCFNSNDFSKIYLGMVQFHLLLPGVFYTRLYLDLESKKQESSGVATLEVDGCYMEDNKSKAEALSKQFQSVFTDEDMSTLPL